MCKIKILLKGCKIMKMFKVLLGNSGIKVISLVAIRKKGNCDPWTNHLLSREGIEEIESFIEW